MRVAVSGDKGFIGQNLVGRLTKKQVEILSLDSLIRGDKGSLPDLAGCEWIVHLAARSRPNSAYPSSRQFQANIDATRMVCELARARKIPVLMISTYLYGKHSWPPPRVAEDFPVVAHSPYAHSKLVSEQILKELTDQTGLPTAVIRLFNVYGPGQPDDYVIPKIVKSLVRSTPLALDNTESSRDFVYIDDVIDLIEKIIRSSPNGFQVVNCGSGQATRIAEVLEFVSSKLEIENTPYPLTCRVPNEVWHSGTADVSAANRLYFWKPSVAIRDGLGVMVELELASLREKGEGSLMPEIDPALVVKRSGNQ
jgi:nucleoside-diphosphate-sugar epimerase